MKRSLKLEDFSLRITYMLNGTETVVGDGDANVAVEKLLDDGRLVVKINAAKKVRLVSARMVQSRTFEEGESFFGGGYQSWTLTREYSPPTGRSGSKTSPISPWCAPSHRQAATTISQVTAEDSIIPTATLTSVTTA